VVTRVRSFHAVLNSLAIVSLMGVDDEIVLINACGDVVDCFAHHCNRMICE